jgi:hypothetical protein
MKPGDVIVMGPALVARHEADSNIPEGSLRAYVAEDLGKHRNIPGYESRTPTCSSLSLRGERDADGFGIASQGFRENSRLELAWMQIGSGKFHTEWNTGQTADHA